MAAQSQSGLPPVRCDLVHCRGAIMMQDAALHFCCGSFWSASRMIYIKSMAAPEAAVSWWPMLLVAHDKRRSRQSIFGMDRPARRGRWVTRQPGRANPARPRSTASIAVKVNISFLFLRLVPCPFLFRNSLTQILLPKTSCFCSLILTYLITSRDAIGPCILCMVRLDCLLNR